MNYHDTVPTQPGLYFYNNELYKFDGDKWWRQLRGNWASIVWTGLPVELLGPLPETCEQAIGLACEVAFARMAVAASNAVMALRFDDTREASPLRMRFLEGERSLSLLREMERVTAELTRK